MIERRRYSEHPPRDEYVLTGAGKALGPILGKLREWGEQFATTATPSAPSRPNRRRYRRDA